MNTAPNCSPGPGGNGSDSGRDRHPRAGRPVLIDPEELWGNRNSLEETRPLLEAYLAAPAMKPDDGTSVPRPPDIDDPAYVTPARIVSSVVELEPKRRRSANGNYAARDDEGDGEDDDEVGF